MAELKLDVERVEVGGPLWDQILDVPGITEDQRKNISKWNLGNIKASSLQVSVAC